MPSILTPNAFWLRKETAAVPCQPTFAMSSYVPSGTASPPPSENSAPCACSGAEASRETMQETAALRTDSLMGSRGCRCENRLDGSRRLGFGDRLPSAAAEAETQGDGNK